MFGKGGGRIKGEEGRSGIEGGVRGIGGFCGGGENGQGMRLEMNRDRDEGG